MICVCVLFAVVWMMLGVVGGRLGSVMVGGVKSVFVVSLDFVVSMAGPGICILCQADAFAS